MGGTWRRAGQPIVQGQITLGEHLKPTVNEADFGAIGGLCPYEHPNMLNALDLKLTPPTGRSLSDERIGTALTARQNLSAKLPSNGLVGT